MNVGIILAAGKSSRFNSLTPKQLYLIDGKPVINYSIDVLSQYLDEIIIISNSDCFDKIKTNSKILINDVDNRIESIKRSLDYLNNDWDNILIHDAARPFINSDMILKLLKSQKENSHSQYYLPIVNGLAQNSNGHWEIPNRNDFIQLCSPQITDFKLFKSIFKNHIETGLECEILPVVSRSGLKFNLIEGNYRDLRKVTTLEDLL